MAADFPLRFAEQHSVMITFRITPTEKRYLDDLAATAGLTQAQFLRMALDHYIEDQLRCAKGSKGSPEAGSKKAPAASTAKVKKPSKRSPSK